MKVLKYPHPILKYKAKPIRKIDAELREIVAGMFETMYETEGVGLAANQVGLPYQLFVMNPTGDRETKEEEYVFINPIILKKSGKAEESEGCLSFPGVHANVIRAESIIVESIALNGEEQRFEWKGHPARVVQHETDHLNGIGFVDRLSPTALIEIREDLDDLQAIFEGDRRLGFVPSDEVFFREIKALEEKYC